MDQFGYELTDETGYDLDEYHADMIEPFRQLVLSTNDRVSSDQYYAFLRKVSKDFIDKPNRTLRQTAREFSESLKQTHERMDELLKNYEEDKKKRDETRPH